MGKSHKRSPGSTTNLCEKYQPLIWWVILSSPDIKIARNRMELRWWFNGGNTKKRIIIFSGVRNCWTGIYWVERGKFKGGWFWCNKVRHMKEDCLGDKEGKHQINKNDSFKLQIAHTTYWSKRKENIAHEKDKSNNEFAFYTNMNIQKWIEKLLPKP